MTQANGKTLIYAMASLGLMLKGRHGPYIGPKGGKWADPQHKHAWQGNLFDSKPAVKHEHDHPKLLVTPHSKALQEVAAATGWSMLHTDIGTYYFEKHGDNRLLPMKTKAGWVVEVSGPSGVHLLSGGHDQKTFATEGEMDLAISSHMRGEHKAKDEAKPVEKPVEQPVERPAVDDRTASIAESVAQAGKDIGAERDSFHAAIDKLPLGAVVDGWKKVQVGGDAFYAKKARGRPPKDAPAGVERLQHITATQLAIKASSTAIRNALKDHNIPIPEEWAKMNPEKAAAAPAPDADPIVGYHVYNDGNADKTIAIRASDAAQARAEDPAKADAALAKLLPTQEAADAEIASRVLSAAEQKQREDAAAASAEAAKLKAIATPDDLAWAEDRMVRRGLSNLDMGVLRDALARARAGVVNGDGYDLSDIIPKYKAMVAERDAAHAAAIDSAVAPEVPVPEVSAADDYRTKARADMAASVLAAAGESGDGLSDGMKTQRAAVLLDWTPTEQSVKALLQKIGLDGHDHHELAILSSDLVKSLREKLAGMFQWKEKEQTKAQIKVLIRDKLWAGLPGTYSDAEAEKLADKVYNAVYYDEIDGLTPSADSKRDEFVASIADEIARDPDMMSEMLDPDFADMLPQAVGHKLRQANSRLDGLDISKRVLERLRATQAEVEAEATPSPVAKPLAASVLASAKASVLQKLLANQDVISVATNKHNSREHFLWWLTKVVNDALVDGALLDSDDSMPAVVSALFADPSRKQAFTEELADAVLREAKAEAKRQAQVAPTPVTPDDGVLSAAEQKQREDAARASAEAARLRAGVVEKLAKTGAWLYPILVKHDAEFPGEAAQTIKTRLSDTLDSLGYAGEGRTELAQDIFEQMKRNVAAAQQPVVPPVVTPTVEPEPVAPAVAVEPVEPEPVVEPVVEPEPVVTPAPEPELDIDTSSDQALEDEAAEELRRVEGPEDIVQGKKRIAANAKAVATAEQVKSERRKLTEDEYEIVKAYTGEGGIGASLNQYFTRRDLVVTVWEILKKLFIGDKPLLGAGARVLEPACGAGAFIGGAPDGVKVTGVEIDQNPAVVASVLYPKHEVKHASFEAYTVSQSNKPAQFDAVIGNAPFITRTGNVARLHRPEERVADRYFLDTSLEHAKDGGVVAMIVHKSVMSGQGAREYRERLLAQAEIVDAYRLPRETFKHAGTEVVSDLIVLRKRPAAEAAMLRELQREGRLADMAGTLGDATAKAMVEGKFFDVHPERVLGKTEMVMGRFGMAPTVIGNADDLPKLIKTLSDKPINAGSYMLRREALQARLDSIDETTPEDEASKERELLTQALNAEPAKPPKAPVEGDMNEFGVGPSRGRYVFLSGEWQPITDAEAVQTVIERTGNAATREAVVLAQDITDMLKIRDGWTDKLSNVYHEPDFMRARGLRRELQARVENWVAANGIPMEHKQLVKLAQVAPVLNTLLGAVGDGGQISDALRKDPILVAPPDSKVDRTSLAAVIKHIAIRDGEIDPDQVASFWTGAEGMDRDQVRSALLASPDVMIETPGNLGDSVRFGRLHHREDYVTGKVYDKLDGAQKEKLAANERGDTAMVDKMQQQEDALQAVIATRHRPLETVNLSIDQRWIPLDIVSAFLSSPEGKEKWGATATQAWENRAAKSGTHGIESFDLYEDNAVIHARVKLARSDEPVDLLTSRKAHPMMKYINGMGIDRDQIEEFDRVNAAFNDWLRSSEHAKRIEQQYNRMFFGDAARRFSNAPLLIKGMNPKITPHGYQNEAVRWGMEMGRGLFAQGTGLGKTFIIIMLHKMMRDAGLIRRALIPVPKSVVTNWEVEIETLFPGSRVMVIGEHKVIDPATGKPKLDPKSGQPIRRTDNPTERDRKLSDIRQNDYDFVLITKPAFHSIKMSHETLERYAKDPEMRTSYMARRGAALKSTDEAPTKAEEKAAARAEAAAEAELLDRSYRQKHGSTYFEDLGVDAILMDEAQSLKNLYLARDRFGEKPMYLGGGAVSNASKDMLDKSTYIREQAAKRGQKGAIFLATATPTKNSPVEIFNLIEQVAPEEWEALGIKSAEDFITRHCKIQIKPALSISGKSSKDTSAQSDDDDDEPQDQTVNSLDEIDGDIVEKPCVTGFQHLLELQDMLARHMMVRNAVDVGLAEPARVLHEVMVPMLPEQQVLYKQIQKKLHENREAAEPDPSVMLTALTDMFQVSQDLHIYNQTQARRKDGVDLGYTRDDGMRSPKYVKCADQVAANIRNGKGGQIVFAEQIIVHGMLREMLIARGIRPEKIGVINASEAPDSGARQGIGDAFNRGDLQVVIGNTGTMGEGVNLQGKNHVLGTTDIHHVDLPWDPGSKTQRDGRGVRQGNPSKQVDIWEYLSEGSADGYRAVSLRGKQTALATLTSGVDEVVNDADMSAQIEQLADMAKYSSDPEAGKKWAEQKQKFIEEKYAIKCAARDIEKFHALQRDKEAFRKMSDPDRKASLGARIRSTIEQLRVSALPDNIVAALDDPKAVAVGPAGGVMQMNVVYEVDGKKLVVDKIDPGQRQMVLRQYGEKVGVPVTRSYDRIPAQSSLVSKPKLTRANEWMYFVEHSGLSSNTITTEVQGKKKWDKKQVIGPSLMRMFNTASKEDQQRGIRQLISRNESHDDKVLVRLPATATEPSKLAVVTRTQLVGSTYERAILTKKLENARSSSSTPNDYWDKQAKVYAEDIAELPPDGPPEYGDAEVIMPWEADVWKNAAKDYHLREQLRAAKGGTFGIYEYGGY